ncbi:acetoin dehydrogenase dihydrolipoyllysine-residue acetyltransferase subunit [Prodigiosinella aquatilis]|nr:acetoin dehydrogenase dihydrolipoyllysine-residue acetyltransferase subunit [Prodigiosinella sp. LS101]WJV54406.1 acetoin dehydrogenase dihydrolipoyllysine-residue acetyltransferase subunit [Prodigiosinella sp. LS101]WJV58767.1 acetoin dehydrogenase dihydrolipoyllysine-residue acetyltransferase subunit [Pectobacteriaceae bacterium C111]
MSNNTIIPVVMPKWGLSMREGTVNEWLVDEGSEITPGMAILNVETDKIANAVEATDAGILRRKVAEPGDILPVKALLGVLAPSQIGEEDINAFIAAWETPPDSEEESEDEQAAAAFLTVNGLRIRYASRGAGEETVLFIHGFGGDLDNWLFNLDALAEHYRVIALDLPGHGQSATQLPGPQLNDLADFITAFMDALSLPTAHQVGHSLGGAIAAELAVRHPGRVRSLALIGSAGFGQEINHCYTEGFINAQVRRDLKPVVELLFSDPALVSRQMLDDLLRYKRLDGVGDALTTLQNSLFADGRQSTQPGLKLDDAGIPLLLIWGAEDQIIPVQHAEQAQAYARVEILSAAGHMPQMEKAAEVNQLLLQHLGAI